MAGKADGLSRCGAFFIRFTDEDPHEFIREHGDSYLVCIPDSSARTDEGESLYRIVADCWRDEKLAELVLNHIKSRLPMA